MKLKQRTTKPKTNKPYMTIRDLSELVLLALRTDSPAMRAVRELMVCAKTPKNESEIKNDNVEMKIDTLGKNRGSSPFFCYSLSASAHLHHTQNTCSEQEDQSKREN